MTRTQTVNYRTQLEDLLPRVADTAARLEEQARNGVGGEAGGSLSNAPMHLGDLGTAAYEQELNATLLENETYLVDEVRAALDRLDAGTFGTCERCEADIPAERLALLPYVRYCVGCAELEHDGPAVNINAGRPSRWTGPHDRTRSADGHAAGTPGGGSAVGGLAGTNEGDGDPAGTDLGAAMGSGSFDAHLDDENPAEQADGYAGHSGGAVGGTPAGKRVSGGRAGG